MSTLRSPIQGSGGGLPGTGRSPTSFAPAEPAGAALVRKAAGTRFARLAEDARRERREAGLTDGAQRSRPGAERSRPGAAERPASAARAEDRAPETETPVESREPQAPEPSAPATAAAIAQPPSAEPILAAPTEASEPEPTVGQGVPTGTDAPALDPTLTTPLPAAPADAAVRAAPAQGAPLEALAAAGEHLSSPDAASAPAPGEAPASASAPAAKTAAAPAAQAAPASEAELERAAAVLRQLEAKLHPGLRRVRVDLDPPELGRLVIQVERHAGGLRAVVEAFSPATLDLLERQAPELRVALAQHGIEASQVALRLGSHSSGTPRERQEPRALATARGARTTPAAAIESRVPGGRALASLTSAGVDTYA